MQVAVAAVDLGASSGRVMLGRVGDGVLELREARRFDNGPVQDGEALRWDIRGLHTEMLAGLRSAGHEAGGLASIGIDSWAVDYGLLDASGTLLEDPLHYRDARTDGIMERFLTHVPRAEIYATTGLQFLPFNTIYQLIASAGTPQLAAARTLLLIPDLLAYWLTGEIGAEITNASTTQLLDVRARTWSSDLAALTGIDPAILPPLREPGTAIGTLTAAAAQACDLRADVPVTAVGSHDTASAVVGVPASSSRFAYVSCGTWSLVGLELDAPVLTAASREANFTNELGVDGTVRYLRNVMGLWLLSESLRTWEEAGEPSDLSVLLAEAAELPGLRAVVDPDERSFLPPGDMPARIAEVCRRTDQHPPTSRAALVRCILDSLALAYRRTVRTAQELTGRHVEVVHLVGGGSRNALLCQLTADACEIPVLAGPVEATALGNVLVQGRALGAVEGDLGDLRALLRSTQALVRYEPTGDGAAWRAAEARVGISH